MRDPKDRLSDSTSVGTTFCRSEEHTSELQSQSNLVCRLLLEKKNVDRKSTRLNSSHSQISYAVFCLKKKTDATVDSVRPDKPNTDDRRHSPQPSPYTSHPNAA